VPVAFHRWVGPTFSPADNRAGQPTGFRHAALYDRLMATPHSRSTRVSQADPRCGWPCIDAPEMAQAPYGETGPQLICKPVEDRSKVETPFQTVDSPMARTVPKLIGRFNLKLGDGGRRDWPLRIGSSWAILRTRRPILDCRIQSQPAPALWGVGKVLAESPGPGTFRRSRKIIGICCLIPESVFLRRPLSLQPKIGSYLPWARNLLRQGHSYLDRQTGDGGKPAKV